MGHLSMAMERWILKQLGEQLPAPVTVTGAMCMAPVTNASDRLGREIFSMAADRYRERARGTGNEWKR